MINDIYHSLVTFYYIYVVYEIIQRIFNVEKKIIMFDLEDHREMRTYIYQKMGISLILTLLPAFLQYKYKEISAISLSMLTLGIHLCVSQMIDLELTKEELEFVDY